MRVQILSDLHIEFPGNTPHSPTTPSSSSSQATSRPFTRECREAGVTLLDPGAITVDGIRFISATLWADFLLEGVADEAWTHLEVGQGLADFTGAIRHRGRRDGLFTRRECARRHAERQALPQPAGL